MRERRRGPDLHGRCTRAVGLAEAERWARRIGRRIRQVRHDLDVAADELAAALGVDRSFVFAWESGVRRVPLRRVYQIAAALGVRVDDLLGLT
jgi:DNA-binding XRE family transcriptional regulator